tara:strand:- start:28 stop:1113 length:1086 start_codon:yes stop_codon:yes gene_type:complete
MTKHVSSLIELDNYLSTQDTKNCNFVGYIWHEYGFLPIFFNDLFKEFFDTIDGKTIGTCFPGHEIFYEDKVDELIVLDGFIDTRKTYVDNKESDLLLENFSKIKDKGIAFWYTLRNFDEDDYDSVLSKYEFKNTLFPIGRTVTWDKGLYLLSSNFNGYKYAGGERDYWFNPTLSHMNRHGHTGWNLENWKKDREFEKIEDGEYSVIFVKNTWKTRKGNGCVGDGTEGEAGYGFLDFNLFEKIVQHYIDNKRKLVIVNDLVKFPMVKSPYIVEFDMIGHFDVKRYLSLIHHSKIFMSSSTAPMDLATYYCDTNYVVFDDSLNRNIRFFSKIAQLRNKKSISVESHSAVEWENLRKFINEIYE